MQMHFLMTERIQHDILVSLLINGKWRLRKGLYPALDYNYSQPWTSVAKEWRVCTKSRKKIFKIIDHINKVYNIIRLNILDRFLTKILRSIIDKFIVIIDSMKFIIKWDFTLINHSNSIHCQYLRVVENMISY